MVTGFVPVLASEPNEGTVFVIGFISMFSASLVGWRLGAGRWYGPLRGMLILHAGWFGNIVIGGAAWVALTKLGFTESVNNAADVFLLIVVASVGAGVAGWFVGWVVWSLTPFRCVPDIGSDKAGAKPPPPNGRV